jgi:hypothetical protein
VVGSGGPDEPRPLCQRPPPPINSCARRGPAIVNWLGSKVGSGPFVGLGRRRSILTQQRQGLVVKAAETGLVVLVVNLKKRSTKTSSGAMARTDREF